MNGNLTIITGCMYSGKTTELMKQIISDDFMGIPYFAFNHSLDSGAKNSVIRGHNKIFIPAQIASSGSAILEFLKGKRYNTIYINELQFFEPDIIDAIKLLIKDNRNVYGCGLDLSSFGKPFPIVSELLCLADSVIKLKARCRKCGFYYGKTATRTQRLVKSDVLILPQDENQKIYEPRCIEHFEP